MAKQKDILGPAQRLALIIVYLFVAAILFLAGWYGLKTAFSPSGIHMALYVILFLLIAALLGAWLWVLIKLPQGLANAFDDIKNRIAGGEISSVEGFSKALGRFMVDYFSFFRFDVAMALISIKGNDDVVYPEEADFPVIDKTELTKRSQQAEGIMLLGKQNAAGQVFYGYVMPIWFGNDWLGYICVYTDTPLIRMFRNMLEVFEDQYIDDQLMHVLHADRINHTHRLCSGIDRLQDDITGGQIKNLNGYFEKLLGLLTEETNCKAAFARHVFSKDMVCRNIAEVVARKTEIAEYGRIVKTEDATFRLALAKRVGQDETLAVIVLLDPWHENITRARHLLESCLMIKIRQQLLLMREKYDLKPTGKID